MSQISSKEVGLAAILNPKSKTKVKQGKDSSGFGSLLSSANKTNEDPKLAKDLAKDLANTKELIDAKDTKLADGEELLSSFMQVLSILELLQSDSKDIKLGNFTKLFTNINNTALDELKEAKDIKELIDIANKLDLNIKKIDFKLLNEKELAKSFPILKEKNFFKPLDQKLVLSAKSEQITKEKTNKQASTLEKLLEDIDEKSYKRAKKSDQINEVDELLNRQIKPNKDLDSKDDDKNTKNELKSNKIDQADIKDTKIEQRAVNTKNEDVSKAANNTKAEIKTDIKTELKPELKPELKTDIKTELKTDIKTEVKPEVKPELNTSKESIKADVSKENAGVLKDDIKIVDDKISQKSSKIRQTPENQAKINEVEQIKEKDQITTKRVDTKDIKDIKEPKDIKDISSIIKEPRLASINEPKKEGIKNDKKSELKLELNHNEPKKDLLKELLAMNEKNKDNKDKPREDSVKIDANESKPQGYKSDFNTIMQKMDNTAKPQALKQTLNHFANDLYEAAKDYKAPLSKLSINLNPHNLGEVEVTLTQRGNNLHVSFSSNSNTMQLFLANQAEFKASLVNMGFGELQMSFSEKKEGQSGQEGKDGTKNKTIHEEEAEESTLELEIAKYF